MNNFLLIVCILYFIGFFGSAFYHLMNDTPFPSSLWTFLKITFLPYVLVKLIKNKDFFKKKDGDDKSFIWVKGPQIIKTKKIYTEENPHGDANRVESGATVFNDDWPGLFLRGDHSMEVVMSIRSVIRKYRAAGLYKNSDFDIDVLEGLAETIEEDVIQHSQKEK